MLPICGRCGEEAEYFTQKDTIRVVKNGVSFYMEVEAAHCSKCGSRLFVEKLKQNNENKYIAYK
jgi:DNA-directed RNA polymerase subunit RPC12/RpoP